MYTGSNTAISTKPVITGTFSVVSLADEVKDMQGIVYRVSSRFLQEAKSKIMAELVEDTEWRGIARYLHVSFEDNDLIISVDHPQAAVLEYGTPDTPMRPKLRELSAKYSSLLIQELNSELSKVFL